MRRQTATGGYEPAAMPARYLETDRGRAGWCGTNSFLGYLTGIARSRKNSHRAAPDIRRGRAGSVRRHLPAISRSVHLPAAGHIHPAPGPTPQCARQPDHRRRLRCATCPHHGRSACCGQTPDLKSRSARWAFAAGFALASAAPTSCRQV